jgi:hypothetical protein
MPWENKRDRQSYLGDRIPGRARSLRASGYGWMLVEWKQGYEEILRMQNVIVMKADGFAILVVYHLAASRASVRSRNDYVRHRLVNHDDSSCNQRSSWLRKPFENRSPGTGPGPLLPEGARY